MTELRDGTLPGLDLDRLNEHQAEAEQRHAHQQAESDWLTARETGRWPTTGSGGTQMWEDFQPGTPPPSLPADPPGPYDPTGKHAYLRDASSMVIRNVRCTVCDTMLGVYYGTESEWDEGMAAGGAQCADHRTT